MMATDFHCHLLSGLDDGARTVEESLEMARVLARAGYRRVCCTPHHIRDVWHQPAGTIRQAVAGLQQRLDDDGIPLILSAGREYYLDEFLLQELDDPLLLPGGLLLVELPRQCDPDQVRETVFQLVRRKFLPLIAHPERSPLLAPIAGHCTGKGFLAGIFGSRQLLPTTQQSPLMTYMRDLGCGFQGNLGSFPGVYGEQVRANAVRLMQAGVYTHFGSDGHSPRHLDQIVADGQREIGRLGTYLEP